MWLTDNQLICTITTTLQLYNDSVAATSKMHHWLFLTHNRLVERGQKKKKKDPRPINSVNTHWQLFDCLDLAGLTGFILTKLISFVFQSVIIVSSHWFIVSRPTTQTIKYQYHTRAAMIRRLIAFFTFCFVFLASKSCQIGYSLFIADTCCSSFCL